MVSAIATNITYNELEYFTYLNHWLSFLLFFIGTLYSIIKVTTLYYSKVKADDSFLELVCSLFLVLFLGFIVSPALIVLLDMDSLIMPSFIIYNLGFQWAWSYSICYLHSALVNEPSSEKGIVGFIDSLDCYLQSSYYCSTGLSLPLAHSHFSMLSLPSSLSLRPLAIAASGCFKAFGLWPRQTLASSNFTCYPFTFGCSFGCYPLLNSNLTFAASGIAASGCFNSLLSLRPLASANSGCSFNYLTLAYFNLWSLRPLASANFVLQPPAALLNFGLSFGLTLPSSPHCLPELLFQLQFSMISSLIASIPSILSLPSSNYPSYPLLTNNLLLTNYQSLTNYPIIPLYLFELSEYLVVPLFSCIKVYCFSLDVIHSLSFYSFGFKVDAIPGRLNLASSLRSLVKGVNRGFCYELCGEQHNAMLNTWLTMEL